MGLRGYAQRDPLNEYKSESFTLFESMLARLRTAVTEQLMHIQLAPQAQFDMDMPELPEMQAHHFNPLTGEDDFQLEEQQATGTDGPVPSPRKAARGGNGPKRQPTRNAKPGAAVDPNDTSTWGKVARNAPCPCGSGKKFKHCHGALVS